MTRPERLIIVIGLAALILIPGAVLLFSDPGEPVSLGTDLNALPVPGAPGAQHWHASLIVNIEGSAIDFGDSKYMIQSKLVHFEDDDPFVVHKHTTGVTIPYFLSTLKIFMDKHCIDFQNLEEPKKYCTNASNTLHFLANGEEIADPERYEIKNNERYLVYYGPATGIQLKFFSNQVPPVPEFREKTVDEMLQELDVQATP